MTSNQPKGKCSCGMSWPDTDLLKVKPGVLTLIADCPIHGKKKDSFKEFVEENITANKSISDTSASQKFPLVAPAMPDYPSEERDTDPLQENVRNILFKLYTNGRTDEVTGVDSHALAVLDNWTEKTMAVINKSQVAALENVQQVIDAKLDRKDNPSLEPGLIYAGTIIDNAIAAKNDTI